MFQYFSTGGALALGAKGGGDSGLAFGPPYVGVGICTASSVTIGTVSVVHGSPGFFVGAYIAASTLYSLHVGKVPEVFYCCFISFSLLVFIFLCSDRFLFAITSVSFKFLEVH